MDSVTRPIALCSAAEQTALLRTKQASSRELLDAYLERIARLDPSVNAVVTLDAEAARRRAQAADDATARGVSWGSYRVGRLRAETHRSRRRPVTQCRRDRLRQDQRAQVVARLCDDQRGVRYDGQSMARRPRSGRLVGWRGGCHQRGLQLARDRH
ncbi:MAG: hypothetical protein E6G39_06455 [Actinobacteria bacterium]|nr:MAG: hypothetical protein E6G39_06455 [Actinomycetota bacterium]